MKRNQKIEKYEYREQIDVDDILDSATHEQVIEVFTAMYAEHKERYPNATSMHFDVQYYGYDGAFNVHLCVGRLETDKEFETRLKTEKRERDRKRAAREKKRQAAEKILMQTETQEKAVLKKLLEKYGTNVE